MVMATFLGSMAGKGVQGSFQDVILWTSGIDYVKPLLSGQNLGACFLTNLILYVQELTTLLVLQIVFLNVIAYIVSLFTLYKSGNNATNLAMFMWFLQNTYAELDDFIKSYLFSPTPPLPFQKPKRK